MKQLSVSPSAGTALSAIPEVELSQPTVANDSVEVEHDSSSAHSSPPPASQMMRKCTVVDLSVKVTRSSASEILEALPKTTTHQPFTSVHVQPEY